MAFQSVFSVITFNVTIFVPKENLFDEILTRIYYICNTKSAINSGRKCNCPHIVPESI